jgi:hypothetical protein
VAVSPRGIDIAMVKKTRAKILPIAHKIALGKQSKDGQHHPH